MNRNKFLIALVSLVVLGLSACGQKGPLIVERTNDEVRSSQEGLPNEISPSDGSESESEQPTEDELEEQLVYTPSLTCQKA